MSSIQEKLEHFNDVILKDAIAERDRILESTRTQMEERISQEKRKFQEQAEGLFKKEVALAENAKNTMVSRAIIESRLQLIKAREEILQTVLNDAEKVLKEFVCGEEYLQYLSRQIKQSCSLAGEGELVVYITSKDLARFSAALEDIKEELPDNTAFVGVDDDIIGGCRVQNLARDMVVNNTLSEKLKAGMDNFFEVCNLKID